MEIAVLSSGSKGNSTLVKTQDINILIDAGIPLITLKKRIEDLPKIDVLIITHSHTDHTKGIKSIIKAYNPLLLTRSDEIINENYTNKISMEEETTFITTKIKLFPLSHDVPCSGILIKENDKELIYITDTGYINRNIIKNIKNKDMYIMESNHDVEMLRNGRYPEFLQARVWSDKGHLSNEQARNYLNQVVGENTKYIVLAHLSEENNTEELVKDSTKDIKVKKIYIAKQNEALEAIEV